MRPRFPSPRKGCWNIIVIGRYAEPVNIEIPLLIEPSILGDKEVVLEAGIGIFPGAGIVVAPGHGLDNLACINHVFLDHGPRVAPGEIHACGHIGPDSDLERGGRLQRRSDVVPTDVGSPPVDIRDGPAVGTNPVVCYDMVASPDGLIVPAPVASRIWRFRVDNRRLRVFDVKSGCGSRRGTGCR